jgi:hypothetical protein
MAKQVNMVEVFSPLVTAYVVAENNTRDAMTALCGQLAKSAGGLVNAYAFTYQPKNAENKKHSDVYQAIYGAFVHSLFGEHGLVLVAGKYKKGAPESIEASAIRSEVSKRLGNVRTALAGRMEEKQREQVQPAPKSKAVDTGTPSTGEDNAHLTGDSALPKVEHNTKDKLSADALKKRIIDLILDVSASNDATVKANRPALIEALKAAECALVAH